MPPVFTFFTRVDINEDEYVQPNLELEFPKSHHLVAGYDWNITKGTRLKTEIYYQHVYDAVVETSPSPFSMINNSSMNFEIPDSLVNGGTGENYGIELTLEKFMDKGFYYLLTTSLFRSEYTGSDDTTRFSAFDGIYVANLLAGKEFKLPSKKLDKKMYLTVDGRITSAGGQRYTPVDLVASAESNSTKYIMHQAFEKRFKPYFRADIRVAFRIDSRRFSQEWAFDVQNITNRENPLYIRYNRLSNTTSTIYQLKMFPMFQYKIMF
jgi:outer membrane receptor protein involved in Fe transport